MRILLLAPSFPPAVAAGGPARSLSNLVAKHRHQHEFTVICPDRDLNADAPFPGLSGRRVEIEGASLLYADLSNPRHVLSLVNRVRHQDFDVVVLNSLWNRRLTLMPLLLRELRILKGARWVLAPRGELDPGALEIHGARKKILGPAVHHLVRRNVDTIACTSEIEAAQSHRFLSGTPTLQTTNVPTRSQPGYRPGSDGLRVVFISRVSRKKDLLTVFEALTHVRKPVTFTVFGPIEDQRYWGNCLRTAERFGSHIQFRYGGLLHPDEVPASFAASDLFVFPTQGENFGHVIAEALQVGCPVLTRDTTPWSEHLERFPTGVLPRSATSVEFARAISTWADFTPKELLGSRVLSRALFNDWHRDRAPDLVEALSAESFAGAHVATNSSGGPKATASLRT